MQINEKALEAARKDVKAQAIYDPIADVSTLADTAIRAYLEAATPPDVVGLVERLEKRAKEDDDCADNSRAVADLLSPELARFNDRDEAGWNTYAVRMAVDHRNSMERDRRYAADLRQAATALRLSAGGGVPDIETIARAIDPDAWADDLPVPTRADVVAFHEGRARSIAAARRVVEAISPASPTGEAGHVE